MLRARHRRLGLASLCTLHLAACGGGRGIVGAYDSSGTDAADGGSSDATADTTAGDCVADCDPDFAITRLSMPNVYATRVHLLGTDAGTCEGDRCPDELPTVMYGGEVVGACADTPEAQASPLGPEEYCRPAANVAVFDIEVGFATDVDRPSFERVRAAPGGGGEEAYWWATGAVTLHGPGTRYRMTLAGSQSAADPDISLAARNLTCIERLEDQGVAWTPATLDALCSTTWDDGGTPRPLRLATEATFVPRSGLTSALEGSCSTPAQGDDTCCNACDHQLSTAIAKYGVTAQGERRDPAAGTALTCDPDGDRYIQCRDFVPSVDRSLDSALHRYAWDGGVESWPMPLFDKLRETHPDLRPSDLETHGAACTNDDTCDEGWRCIGSDDQGRACAAGADCDGGVCRAPWTVTCSANVDTTGSTGYCVDARFDDVAATACYVAASDYEHGAAGDRLVTCDADGDGAEASECCDPALGGDAVCDPLMQPGVTALPRSDREPSLDATWQCTCDEQSAALPECAAVVETWCAAPLGDPDGTLSPSPAGSWATQGVRRRGGLRWDPELAHVEILLADLGGQARAHAESCAEGRGRVPQPTPTEDVRPQFLPELDADYDVALCSGSTYRLEFTDASAPQHIRSAAGGTLEGRAVHVFETAQFRVIPGSAFPTDDLDIGACDDVVVRFSNKFDLSPTNLRKLELRDAAGLRVAGGLDCDPDATPEEIVSGAIPCLTVDVTEEFTAGLAVSIDQDVHGPVLQPGERYDLVIPGLPDIAAMADATAYAAAFHDACGMPLVLGDTEEVLALSRVSFLVDGPCE